MSKKHMDIVINDEVWWLLQQKIPAGNRSGLINNLLKSFLEYEHQDTDEDKLLKEINDVDKEREKLNIKFSTLHARLDNLKIENDKNQKEDVARKEALIDSIKASGVLTEICDK